MRKVPGCSLRLGAPAFQRVFRNVNDVLQTPIDDCWNRIGIWGRQTPRCARLEEHVHCRNCEVYRAAGQRLRERPLPADYQAEWTDIIANRKPESQAAGRAALVFRLGREWLALPAGMMEEVMELRPVHTLPHRSSAVLLGLVNIRGKLRLCFSLAALLGIEADGARQHTAGTYPRMLVVKTDGQQFVFSADEVRGTHRHAPEQIGELPATLAGALTRYSSGTLRVGELNVGLLDLELLTYAFTRSLA